MAQNNEDLCEEFPSDDYDHDLEELEERSQEEYGSQDGDNQ